MKLPSEFKAELELLGKKVVAEDISRDDAAQQLASKTFGKAHRHVLEGIVFNFWRGQVNSWIRAWLASLTDAEREQATGIVPLFPWLPELIEVAPGRFVHQNAMRADDIRRAVVQAQTKADNATGYAKRIARLAEAALPLMPDEATTLADIAERLIAVSV